MEERADKLVRKLGAIMFMIGVLLVTISVFCVFGWRIGIGATGAVVIVAGIALMRT